jgi:hypothetical protein
MRKYGYGGKFSSRKNEAFKIINNSFFKQALLWQSRINRHQNRVLAGCGYQNS